MRRPDGRARAAPAGRTGLALGIGALLVAGITGVGDPSGASVGAGVVGRPAAGLPAPGDSLPRLLDEYLSGLEPFGLAGAFLVARGGEVLLARGYGLAERGDRGGPPRRWTAGTVSTVGSITKQFTAAAILALEEDGALSTGDSLPAFFADVPPDKRGITLHHLLTHTSGLRDLPQGDFDDVDREALVTSAMASELGSAPGQRYAYSNLGYSLLGAVIELVTGTGYEAWVREHLFEPVGMFETGYLLPRFEPDRLAVGYRPAGRFGTVLGRIDPDRGPSWILYANGGMHSTVYDMYRWARALLDDDLLDADSRRRLFGAQVEQPGGHYGYGWSVDTTARATPFIHHGGSNGIFYADYHLFPTEDVVAFAMTSDETVRASDVLRQVDRIVFGDPVPWPPRVDSVADVPADALDRLTGRYGLPAGGALVVVRAGSALLVRTEGQPAVDAVWAGKPVGRVPYDDLNRRAEELVRALAAADWATLRAALRGGSAERPYESAWRSLTEELGPFRDVEVLGTVPAWFHDGSADVTWVRLRFERGYRIRRFHWDEDGAMVGLGGDAYPAPLTLRCVPVSTVECVGFHTALRTIAPTLRFGTKAGEETPGSVTFDDLLGHPVRAERR